MKAFSYPLLSVLCVLAFSGMALGGPLYKYQNEDGVISYTDDKSDPRLKYEAVRSYEPEKGENAKGNDEKATQERGEKESKLNDISPADSAEKNRMLEKVAELEEIKKNTTHERYQEMLQEEIDLLKKQLTEIDRPDKKGGAP